MRAPTYRSTEPLLPAGLLLVKVTRLSVVSAGSVKVRITPDAGDIERVGRREPLAVTVVVDNALKFATPDTLSAPVPEIVP